MTPLVTAALVTGSAVLVTAIIVGLVFVLVAIGGWIGAASALAATIFAMFLFVWFVIRTYGA